MEKEKFEKKKGVYRLRNRIRKKWTETYEKKEYTVGSSEYRKKEREESHRYRQTPRKQ